MTFDVASARAQFPALTHNPLIFLDNPAGTQVPQRVIEAVVKYYQQDNANSGGYFSTSQRTDTLRQSARETLAAFLNANRPEEIVFGANMTTLTLSVSRAIGQTLREGDELIVTQMDHDANINPWLLAARDHGAEVKWVRLDPETGQLDLTSFEQALSHKTRWVCVGHAANALGTINPIQKMAEMAHAFGARIFVDAVQSAPHLPIDVQALDVDMLVCSAYKFYGPHVGVLYGKYTLLEALMPYKVRPAHDEAPDKWETGTASFETIAGTAAAVEYLATFGEGKNLRERLLSSYHQIMQHENKLVWHLIAGLKEIPHLEIRGIIEPEWAALRVPTVIFRLPKPSPDEIAQALARANICVWSGHYYAIETMRALGHEDGMVRIGIAHYNTLEEIDQTLDQITRLV